MFGKTQKTSIKTAAVIDNISAARMPYGVSATRVTVARYEAGTRVPNEIVWETLARIFDTTVSFVKGDGIRIEEAKKLTLNLILSAYYEPEQNMTNLKGTITEFLLLRGSKKTADSFIDPQKNTYTKEPYVNSFWVNEFDFLFTNKFAEYIEGSSQKKFVHKVDNVIRLQVEEIIMSKNDADFIKEYEKVDNKVRTEFFNKFNYYTLVPAMREEIEVLQKYVKRFLSHGYFDKSKKE